MGRGGRGRPGRGGPPPPAPADEIAAADQRADKPAAFQPPGWLPQFFTLHERRWRLFWRDRAQFALQLALLFGFPCLVVIFAWDGLPQIQNLTGTGNAVQQLL